MANIINFRYTVLEVIELMPRTFSPLRYPGGKTKLYPYIQPIIARNLSNTTTRTYIEPFAGGAGLALKLLFNGDVDELVLNDFDKNVFLFWQACLKNSDELCARIEVCNLTIDEWDCQHDIYLNPDKHSNLDVAFSTLYLNRCNVSGIIRGGPIGGRNQSGSYGLDARFNRRDLIKKIQKIRENANRIQFYNYDAIDFFKSILPNHSIESTFLNIDPPYVKKGPALYKNSFSQKDHQVLAEFITQLSHKWVVTYDNCPLIRTLYNDYHKTIISLYYSAGREKRGDELMIYAKNVL